MRSGVVAHAASPASVALAISVAYFIVEISSRAFRPAGRGLAPGFFAQRLQAPLELFLRVLRFGRRGSCLGKPGINSRLLRNPHGSFLVAVVRCGLSPAEFSARLLEVGRRKSRGARFLGLLNEGTRTRELLDRSRSGGTADHSHECCDRSEAARYYLHGWPSCSCKVARLLTAISGLRMNRGRG